MVTSIQGGYRESVIFSQLTTEQAHAGINNLKAMYASWGLPPYDHYDPYLDQIPEFFQVRAEIMYSVLEVINQPYPGYGPEDVAAKLEAEKLEG